MRAVAMSMLSAPPVSHLVEACNLVYTSGKRSMPRAPKTIMDVPMARSAYSIMQTPPLEVFGHYETTHRIYHEEDDGQVQEKIFLQESDQ